MKEQNQHLDHLQEIKKLMEKSSKSGSLSGIAGIIIGILAISGVSLTYYFLDKSPFEPGYFLIEREKFDVLVLIAFIVLFLSLVTGAVMAVKKDTWNDLATKKLLFNLFIPLIVGGIYSITLYYQGLFGWIAPVTMIFYGLGLFSAGKFSMPEIQFLGIIFSALGLFATFLIDYGLLIWGFGFGFLHLIFGIIIYLKYEK